MDGKLPATVQGILEREDLMAIEIATLREELMIVNRKLRILADALDARERARFAPLDIAETTSIGGRYRRPR